MMSKQQAVFCALMALAMPLVLGGCGVSDNWRAELRQSRAQVIRQLTDVASLLQRNTDFRIAEATGGFDSAGSAPTSTWEYHAGASTQESRTSISQRVKLAVRVLKAVGWKMDAQGDASPPYADLVKDGVRVGLSPAGLRGSTAMDFGITGPEIRTPDSANVLPQREDLDLG